MIFLVAAHGLSQNLVRNGSFEKGDCPTSRNYGSSVCALWNTVSTADYFTECSEGEVKPQENFMGQQAPYSGNAFAGMFTGHGTKTYITEVLHTELTKPLEKGKKYRVEFYYSLAENAGLISRSIGCAFSDKFAYKEVKISLGIGYSPIFDLNFVLVEADTIKLSNTENWILFQQEYTALGGEKYLYLAGVPVEGESCIKRKDAPPATVNPYAGYAYYYIDEVSMVKQNEDGSYPIVAPELAVSEEANDYSFSNIYFATKSHLLNDTSIKALNKLAEVLQENPRWGIVIQGHTDTVGNENENLILSESRANTVKEYLLSEGVESERIKIEALGSGTPLSSNASEEERAKNRRVVISLVKD